MKNFLPFLFITLFIFNNAFSQTTWKVLSAPRNPNDYVASSFINDNEGWLIDDSSVLWHTTNGCTTLDSIYSGKYFLKLDFVSSTLGYALNATHLYKTTNGGVTWTAIPTPGSVQNALYFLNKDTGFVSGYNKYYRTTDGGSTWTSIGMLGSWTDYYFINDSTGCVTTNDYYYSHEIYRTTDCGLTWTGVNTEDESHLYSIWFAGKDTGYAAGYYDFGQTYTEMFETIDGGLTWFISYTGEDYESFRDIRFKSNHKDGYAVSDFGGDAITNDGGGNWGTEYDSDTLGLPRFFGITSSLDGFNDMYLSGKYGTLLKWKKDTAQWQDISGRICSEINDVSLTSDTHGWMATNAGVLKTTDGGNTWHSAGRPRVNMTLISAVNDSFIVACGTYWDYPYFYRTTNGGQTWSMLDTSNLSIHMHVLGIKMIDETSGYILSSGFGNGESFAYKTIDGGITWQQYSIASGGEVNNGSMYWLNENEGWVTGNSNGNNFGTSSVFHTSDGGITWTLIYQYTGASYHFLSTFFKDSQNGYLVTSGSNYFVTSDGGTTWTAKSIAGATNYLNVFFADPMKGWFLTKTDVYETTDGGTTWSNSYHAPQELYDLAYGDSTLFVRGYYGFLVKYFTPAPCVAYFTLVADTVTQGLYYGYNLSTGTDLSYTWDWGDSTTSTGEFPTHTYADSGWYNICLSIYDNYNGCTDTFCLNFFIQKMDGEMGIHQIIFVNGAVPTQPIVTDGSVEMNVSPNPFSESTSIELTLSQIADVTIELFDLKGRKIRTVASQSFTEGNHKVNLNRESLSAGIYFLQLKTDEGVVTKKVVIE